jgi:hypothetical protein
MAVLGVSILDVSVLDHNATDSAFLPATKLMLVDLILSFNSGIAVWREVTAFQCK